jgi:hypothetical protein
MDRAIHARNVARYTSPPMVIQNRHLLRPRHRPAENNPPRVIDPDRMPARSGFARDAP